MQERRQLYGARPSPSHYQQPLPLDLVAGKETILGQAETIKHGPLRFLPLKHQHPPVYHFLLEIKAIPLTI